MDWRQNRGNPLSNTRLLVVEEDADLLAAIVGALCTRYRSTWCRSAHRALALLESGRRFDALVLGSEMLEMSGRELHERISGIDFVLGRNSLMVVAGRLSRDDERYIDRSRLRLLHCPFRVDRLRDEAHALAAHAVLARCASDPLDAA